MTPYFERHYPDTPPRLPSEWLTYALHDANQREPLSKPPLWEWYLVGGDPATTFADACANAWDAQTDREWTWRPVIVQHLNRQTGTIEDHTDAALEVIRRWYERDGLTIPDGLQNELDRIAFAKRHDVAAARSVA